MTWDKLETLHQSWGRDIKELEDARDSGEIVAEDVVYFDPNETPSPIAKDLPDDWPLWRLAAHDSVLLCIY